MRYIKTYAHNCKKYISNKCIIHLMYFNKTFDSLKFEDKFISTL